MPSNKKKQPIYTVLAREISKKRKERGLTLEATAKLIGVSRQALFQWETASTRIQVHNLLALARVLEMDLELVE